MNQLQMKVAVLEQEVKDKEQLMRRTREVLEAAQQQKAREAPCAGFQVVCSPGRRSHRRDRLRSMFLAGVRGGNR